MINIGLQRTLIYYDAPQLFVAIDKIETQYLCLVAEQQQDFERCLCVPISPRRLAEFEFGNLDLRSIYQTPETETAFTGLITEGYDTIGIAPVSKEEIREEWLPEAGFYFTPESTDAPEVQLAAQQQNRAIIEVDINPPEARGRHKISPSHLVDFIDAFQLTLKYAYKQAIRTLGRDADDELKSPAAHGVNVVAFAPGSFKIRFESEQSADMLRHVHLSVGLRKLDELTQHLDNPQAALEVLRQNSGHLASAYIRLLESIVENDAPLTYIWSVPDNEQPVTRRITKDQAAPLCELFRSQSELTRVEVDITGYLIKVNVKSGTWTLRREDNGKEVSGSTHEESTQDLSGLVTTDTLYEFHCIEAIEETVGTGRKTTNLFMLYHRTTN